MVWLSGLIRYSSHESRETGAGARATTRSVFSSRILPVLTASRSTERTLRRRRLRSEAQSVRRGASKSSISGRSRRGHARQRPAHPAREAPARAARQLRVAVA